MSRPDHPAKPMTWPPRFLRWSYLPPLPECKPDFLCIGAQKAGTTWLFKQLRTHPGLFLPPIKELHYFDHLHVPENRVWTSKHIRKHAYWQSRRVWLDPRRWNPGFRAYMKRLSSDPLFTEDWYRGAFRHPDAAGKVRGDVTPEYCCIPAKGIDDLVGTFSPLRVIFIIRDPFERAMSQLRMNATRRRVPPTEEKHWNNMVNNKAIVDRGDYRTYIPRWRQRFSDRDLLFLPFGRIHSQPDLLLKEVEQFLGVSHHAYTGLGDKVHPTRPMTIPDSAQRALRELTDPQRAFLEAEFPAGFVSQI